MGHDGERDDGEPSGAGSPNDRPLALLADFSYPSSNRFVHGVRASIDRRTLISDVATGFWFAPVTVLREFVCIGLGLLALRFDSHTRSGSRRT